MVCSRGAPTIAGSRDPRHCRNFFYVQCVPYVQVISPEVVAKGASDCLAQSVWRIPDGSVDPIVKNYHWVDFTNGLFDAKDAGFEPLILTDTGRNITEGPGFNVFAILHVKLLPRGMGFYPVLPVEPFWKLPQNWTCRLIFDLCHTPYFWMRMTCLFPLLRVGIFLS